MPLFEYTARNSANGQIQKGQVEVKSKEEVSAYLRKNRMMLVSVREAPKKMTLGGGLGKAKVKIRDIVIFTRQFATMINAGLPLVQSLSILAEQTENKALAKVLAEVRNDVETGQSLSSALAKHPQVFPPLMINMCRAGEVGGFLDQVLLQIAANFEAEVKLRSKVKSAMTYPVVVFVIAVLAVIGIVCAFPAMYLISLVVDEDPSHRGGVIDGILAGMHRHSPAPVTS